MHGFDLIASLLSVLTSVATISAPEVTDPYVGGSSGVAGVLASVTAGGLVAAAPLVVAAFRVRLDPGKSGEPGELSSS